MKQESFVYEFKSAKTPHQIFEILQDIPQWWSGVFGETITGKSEQVGDEFTFEAGGGAHYSKQQLVELIPDKKIAWQVTDSHLSFLTDKSEWTNSKISFDITPGEDSTGVVFTHEGLVPEIECYKECSNGWLLYLDKLKKKLNEPVTAS